MTELDTFEEATAMQLKADGTEIENGPDPNNDDPVVLELWGSENSREVPPPAAANPYGNLKFELEALAQEKERLKKENQRLAEMLETMKLEEDIAKLKEEVNLLGGERELLLAEIQRKKQAKM